MVGERGRARNVSARHASRQLATVGQRDRPERSVQQGDRSSLRLRQRLLVLPAGCGLRHFQA
jgi:hypothetical protein